MEWNDHSASLRLALHPKNRTLHPVQLGFWAGRKAAFPAAGRISPDYYCMDGIIPRKSLASVLSGIEALSAAKHASGHATLFRSYGYGTTGCRVSFAHAGVMNINRRLKEKFDPMRIFNPGRIYPEL